MKIFVAGHNGLVGSAIVKKLRVKGYNDILTADRKKLDLLNQKAVFNYLKKNKPKIVIIAAAKVGGIHANNAYPAEFIYDNLMMQANIIDAAFNNGVKKLLFLGSSCIYPKLVTQPMSEEALMTGSLEPTNEPYAVAKIAGIKLCESFNRQYGKSHGVDYRSLMPTNLYGQGDNYHPENAHVIPALIGRFHEAKINDAPTVLIWGSGTPFREFLYVDDMAEASVYVMNLEKSIYDEHTQPMLSHINAGSGDDLTIAELAKTISKVVGYNGQIIFDSTRPDGAPRKLMNTTRLNKLGWHARVKLADGLYFAYQDFLKTVAKKL